jgi:hypothetical protein
VSRLELQRAIVITAVISCTHAPVRRHEFAAHLEAHGLGEARNRIGFAPFSWTGEVLGSGGANPIVETERIAELV